jgi:RNA polymerase sigma factor (sigma-70 family)
MSAEPRDSPLALTDYSTYSIESLLRRVAVARRAGDVSKAQPEWEACVIRATPRVRAAVRTYKTVNGDRVGAQDHEAVVNDALERACRRMIHTLDKLDERAFRAALVGCAHNACKDHFRRVGQYAKGIAGSLDQAAFDDGEAGRFDEDLAREAERKLVDDEGAFEAADRLNRAMSQMKHDNRRKAIELRETGLEYDEIAQALDVSVGNAYQLYSRGLKDLHGLMEP